MASPLSEPESVMTESDMRAFAVWAARIADGDVLSADTYHPYPGWMADVAPLEAFERWWGGSEVFHQTPLYAYLLALSYWIGGGKLLLLLLQLSCSTLAVYLVFRLASRVADETAGLVAAALAAVYAPSVVFDTMLLRASLTASLTVASIWLLVRVRDTGRPATALGSGLVLGAGFLMRPVGLALLLGPAVLLTDPAARATWRRWVPWLTMGVVIAFTPFAARNVVVGAPALEFSNRGVEAMIQGNHRGADPAIMMLPSSADYRALMEEADGSVPKALLASIRTWPQDGRAAWWAWHEARKLLAIFRDHEYANNINFYFYRRTTPGLTLLPTFGWIVGLGLVGTVLLVVRGRDRTAGLLLGLAAGGLVGIMLLALATGRYRLPLAMLATIPAGVTVSALREWLTEKRWTPALVCAVAAVTLSACSYRLVPTRAVFDANEQPLFIRGSDARLYEALSALRASEYAEEARLLGTGGEIDAARVRWERYLAEVRETVTEAAPTEDPEARRIVLSSIARQLLWARNGFAGIGLDDFARAADSELEWLRTQP